MKIRIIGNTASGKTTLARVLSVKYQLEILHLDGIAFIPNSNFIPVSDLQFKSAVSEFLNNHQDWIIEGNYIDQLSGFDLQPELIIFLDITGSQAVDNYKQRFKQYEGKSRPELPNLIDTDMEPMLKSIANYHLRRDQLVEYIDSHHSIETDIVHITEQQQLDLYVL